MTTDARVEALEDAVKFILKRAPFITIGGEPVDAQHHIDAICAASAHDAMQATEAAAHEPTLPLTESALREILAEELDQSEWFALATMVRENSWPGWTVIDAAMAAIRKVAGLAPPAPALAMTDEEIVEECCRAAIKADKSGPDFDECIPSTKARWRSYMRAALARYRVITAALERQRREKAAGADGSSSSTADLDQRDRCLGGAASETAHGR